MFPFPFSSLCLSLLPFVKLPSRHKSSSINLTRQSCVVLLFPFFFLSLLFFGLFSFLVAHLQDLHKRKEEKKKKRREKTPNPPKKIPKQFPIGIYLSQNTLMPLCAAGESELVMMPPNVSDLVYFAIESPKRTKKNPKKKKKSQKKSSASGDLNQTLKRHAKCLPAS